MCTARGLASDAWRKIPLRKALITRRTLLQGASVAAAFLGVGEAQRVANSSGSAPAKLKAPRGACDCHHHIYDAVRFPPVQPGGDIIPDARVEEFRLLQE